VALQSTIHTLPLTTLPISQANWLARDCFSDISRALQGHRRSMDATARAQGPHARGNRRHVRGGDAGMKRHRPMAPRTTVYLERRATGSLADLHLHLHAGPLPVGRSICPSVRCDGKVAVLAEGLSNDQTLLSYARRALYLKPLAAPGTRRARQRQCCDIICAVRGVLWERAAR
jgi:hypothetical protein